MATKQKEELSPIGVLIVILAGLMAFGAGGVERCGKTPPRRIPSTSMSGRGEAVAARSLKCV